MKKALLFSLVICSVLKGFAQTDTNLIVSYSGHYYAPNYDNVSYSALRSQKVLDDQKIIDSIASNRYERYVNRTQYDSSLIQVHMLLESSAMKNNGYYQEDLKDFYILEQAISPIVRNSEPYRRMLYVLNDKLLMTIFEPWSADQHKFDIQKSITDIEAFIGSQELNDPRMYARYMAVVKANQRLGSSRYNIVLDPKLLKDMLLGNLEVYVTDRHHYNVSRIRYKFSDAQQGVINNFMANPRESGYLKEYLNSCKNISGEPWFYYMNYSQQMHKKTNMLSIDLANLPDWHLYFFYNNNLYYSSDISKCTGGNCEIYIPYKM